MPPPITMISGSKVWSRLTIPTPRLDAASSMMERASASPPAAASATIWASILAASPPALSSRPPAWSDAALSRAARATAVPEARDSRHPRLPQPHSGPLRSIVTWPSSPANPPPPQVQRVVYDDAAAYARAHRQIEHVAIAPAGTVGVLAESAEAGIVGHRGSDGKRVLESRLDGEVMPSRQVRRAVHHPRVGIDRTRHRYAYAGDRSPIRVGGDPLDPIDKSAQDVVSAPERQRRLGVPVRDVARPVHERHPHAGSPKVDRQNVLSHGFCLHSTQCARQSYSRRGESAKTRIPRLPGVTRAGPILTVATNTPASRALRGSGFPVAGWAGQNEEARDSEHPLPSAAMVARCYNPTARDRLETKRWPS